MSSPMNSMVKDSSFSAVDPCVTAQDEGQQQHLKKEDENPPQSNDSQSPKTVTLEIADAAEPYQPADDPHQNDPDPEEVTAVSPIRGDLHISSSTAARCVGGGGRRKKPNVAQEKKFQKKLETLARTLNFIPFIPVKTLDLSSHEALLKRLGLWDFAHLDYDFKLRPDLILQLIASFNPTTRSSKVYDFRIKVSRADLARALYLPVKKEKVDSALELNEGEESVSFIHEFVSTFVLLHEDTWMMTDEILSSMKLIKEGNFEKVDFATLIWIMIDKELKGLGNCYYASHLQLLIKSQKEDLLKEKAPVRMEIDLREDKEAEEEEEEEVKMSEELSRETELEEQNIELSLGGIDTAVKDDRVKEEEHSDNEDDAMDCEESKEYEQGQSYNHSMDGHFLQRCNMGGVGSVECEDRKQEEEEEQQQDEEEEDDEEEGKEGEYEEKEEEEEEMGFSISPKGVALEGLDSENLMEEVEASENPFCSALQNHVNVSAVDFLDSRVDMAQAAPGGSSLFNNGSGNKRVIAHLENEMPHHSLNSGNKRMRGDEHWEKLKSPSEFDMYIEQMQHVMGKARLDYQAKEQACQDLSMQNRMLLDELEQRTNMIHNLHKAKMEDQQKRQMETYRLEHELYMMGKLLEGYRKALKETTKAFAEYRKKYPSPDSEEPIYKDTGFGGLVLSTTELEKLRLKQEEEKRLNRLLIQKNIKEFEAVWIDKFEECNTVAEFMCNRLLDVEKGVNFCKEEIARRKGSQRSECAPPTEQQVPETTS